MRGQTLVDITRDQLAADAERALGSRVTRGNICAALEATGLEITTSKALAEQAACKTDTNVQANGETLALLDELVDALGGQEAVNALLTAKAGCRPCSAPTATPW